MMWMTCHHHEGEGQDEDHHEGQAGDQDAGGRGQAMTLMTGPGEEVVEGAGKTSRRLR